MKIQPAELVGPVLEDTVLVKDARRVQNVMLAITVGNQIIAARFYQNVR